MKLETINQKKNPFLGREEFVVEITGEAMPTKEGIVEGFGKDKELTVIRKLNSSFGNNKFVADIVVYDDVEAKQKYMTIPKKVRAKMEADSKAAEEAANKAAEEAKAAAEVPAAPEGVPSDTPMSTSEGKEPVVEEKPAEVKEESETKDEEAKE
jgi:ribosomal protein S24E